MSQATYAENGQPLPLHNSGAFQCTINGQSGTKKGSGFERREAIRNFQRVRCRSLHKFRIAAIHGDTGDLLPPAQVFVSFNAEFALPAAPVNPWHADTVADL